MIVADVAEFPVRCTNEFVPGKVFVDPNGHMPKSVFVAAGYTDNGETRSVVELYALQPAGKKKMTAEEFLRGYPIVEGMRFGPEVLS